ncbi:hypothetical protein A4R44_04092 [Amycolatopsis sp. M39]|nr:hypothetical protein A4R44_04092 [Amycolatopsis sp. M39]
MKKKPATAERNLRTEGSASIRRPTHHPSRLFTCLPAPKSEDAEEAGCPALACNKAVAHPFFSSGTPERKAEGKVEKKVDGRGHPSDTPRSALFTHKSYAVLPSGSA